MALLWPDADSKSARHSLRNALYGLRRTLGEAVLVARGEGYIGIDPGAIQLDALELRRLLADGRWEEAVAGWTGDLAPGLHVDGAPEFEQWLENQRTALRRAVNEAAWRRVDELEQSGGASLAPAARRAWELDPANEAGARRLIRILDLTVGRAAAMRAYEDLVAWLHRELEADPSVETRALARELEARTDVGGPVPSPSPTPSTKPTAGGVPVPPVVGSTWNRGTKRIAIAAGLLIAAVLSLFALRYAGTMQPRSAPDSATTQSVGGLPLPMRYRQDTASYGSYLRALELRLHGHNLASRDSFAALAARMPSYGPAYAGLAHAYLVNVVARLTPAAEGYPLTDAAAHRALALDSTLASAYVALGMVEIMWRWNLPQARALIDRALALDPNDPEVHMLRANWFRWSGEGDSSLAEARKTHELDPLDRGHSNLVARLLFLTRRYPESEAAYRETIRNYPASAVAYGELSDLYRATGRPAKALEILRAGARANGDSARAAALPPATSDSQAARVFADLAGREVREVEEAGRAGRSIDPRAAAFAYARLRDADHTLRWLNTMVLEHHPQIPVVLFHPLFDFLRDDPRYKMWEAQLPWRARAPR